MCAGDCGQMHRNDQARVQGTRQARQYPIQVPQKPAEQHNSVMKIRNKRDKAIQDAKIQAFHQNKLGGG